ncbi:grasp-with-spasm system ATP-grasp peptide maturase [Chryseobacterium rhizosphaerae]|uniref:Grasp-with-spasm system ATP-grasp peptide maturase n=1 Tax=Chryseobacterium rhizosphaerae TaxID=395937 RepID=A0ABX9IGN0_9FLAO|nr:grasp-with-spasm system ATP-grasp peptide maturase [Chryseobacterium rhizosphaerae]MDC8101487.1 grasp-with-spasm system ATP-grasp peptide maturase [Chryseobacterium rhizosphaerae]REC72410.1 grasp-with-spasm system ATP-grasp peptide maturase [Chryseobacterium rhizosphaerae]GEN69032.1 glutathione synthetase ATP-binding domain-like superfamily protein [Chryseobacterium rhizosphaerae]
MILIISNNGDTTTTQVIKYLSAMRKPFIRVHEDEFFEIKTDKKRIYMVSERHQFFLDEITSTWYRRGRLKFKRLSYDNDSINIHMDETQHWLEDYVIKTLESKKTINKQTNSHVNKLFVLEQAQKAGLNVPKYFLAENTDEVVVNTTITKAITENVILDSINKYSDAIIYTSIIEEKEKENFFITFFQEKIEKDFEIRSFYLSGKTWSTAIISQSDEQTKTDFRKYNYKKPNRKVPYQLPESIEQKTHQLMGLLDLNCGSIDFIKSGNTFYFLEVNPLGQFLGLSTACNYSLEKEIAQYL